MAPRSDEELAIIRRILERIDAKMDAMEAKVQAHGETLAERGARLDRVEAGMDRHRGEHRALSAAVVTLLLSLLGYALHLLLFAGK